jgi:hypothetical protein
MKSIEVDFDKNSKSIKIGKDAKIQDWAGVCLKFNDDVERVMDVDDQKSYTGLYVCFDDDNNRFYYLVQEDKALFRIKRKHFIDNIGLK